MDESFELLLAKDMQTYFEIIGITYSNALLVQPDCRVLKASFLAIQKAKNALKDGKKVTVGKTTDFPEIQPNDLVVDELDELERYKQMKVNEVAANMHQCLISISVIDLMEYLNNYVNLLNAGYYITDENREDQYFKIIEDSTSCEEPKQLPQDCTYDDELKYAEQKKRYDNAQRNLSMLEKYLNAYDKLVGLKHITEFLSSTRDKIKAAQTVEEVDQIYKVYLSNLENYHMVK